MLQPIYPKSLSKSRCRVGESASWYPPETIPTPTPIDAESAEQELEDEDRLEHMFEDSLITTRLCGPQEPPSDQSTSRPSAEMDKGNAKMPEYEDDHFDGNALTHSLDSQIGGFDVPIGFKKALTSTNEKLHRSTREKNPVSQFGYNDYKGISLCLYALISFPNLSLVVFVAIALSNDSSPPI